ncbi:hypothetical protein BTM25_23480 [Actinomadura rubteroloni]|uniref:Uncharacterized protein n=1 Tax=Actinomadura rubteroloni TaxID=1926885 RepID=A0A2P4UF84_9ACTN|nr:hypothetical protein [Actinomadura rubteroloni]POM23727.1 hypothetical protein BTM25_23480 [Actinomadura rubteroloni]
MSGSIALTVPETTRAAFVVATDRIDGTPSPALRLGPPFAAEAARRLGSPALQITDEAAGTVSCDPTPVTAWPAARRVSVTAILPGGDRPRGAWIARAAARSLAEALDGVVIDPDSGQVLPPRPEPPVFALADDWLGVWLPPHRDAGRCTADEDDVDGCACVEMTTRGLRRLGLPELRVSGVACRHDLAALNLLRAAARRLLLLGDRPGVHHLPREPSLTGDDLAGYWGVNGPVWDDDPVPVLLEPLGPRLLHVGPPSRFPGSLNEWLWEELPRPLYDFLGYDTEPAL